MGHGMAWVMGWDGPWIGMEPRVGMGHGWLLGHGLVWVMGWYRSCVGMAHGLARLMGWHVVRDSTCQGLAWTTSWQAGGPSPGWQEEAAWVARPPACP